MMNKSNVAQQIQDIDTAWDRLSRRLALLTGDDAAIYSKLLAQERSQIIRALDHYQRFGEFKHVEVSSIDDLLRLGHERMLDFEQKIKALEPTANDSKTSEKKQTRQTAPRKDELVWAYEVLKISPDASDEEAKRAYMARVKRNHPDKLSGKELDNEFELLAQKRTQEINRAWLLISKARNLK